MRVRDVMNPRVVTVTPETRVHDVALQLAERRISGMPVVEKGRLVGVVTEADILRRHEIGTEEAWSRRPWWRRVFHAERCPADYVRSHAVRVRDIMTRDVVTVPDRMPLADAAGVLVRRRIRRMPVMRNAALVGTVGRSDIVGALAHRAKMAVARRPLNDRQIHWLLLTELSGQAWWNTSCTVEVKDGLVHYWGLCDNDWQKHAARVAAENIAGVQGVVDHRLTFRQLPMMG